ncbi:GNAT family N-acetyltransferase [Aquimarina sp. MMG015]|uniref:GNAT family N-acetyltransferase n=1 Tax=Aquimarina TaxID=290174 RepID=UPI0004827795|nr:MULTISPECIES: GNAT family N-acetyltransferase [Aquimarina]AXT54576.1 GNAT family N-acetyltransferase [Aquimarina sp. AD1]MBQ4804572.1 GNAT family N-acetyltransferase [Aquimarina sp. MMG015]RKN25026.1 GNAT family N-acetyltransferase [Aquimarina sp. AD1]
MKISYGKAKLTDSLRISVLLKTIYIETYAVDGITFEFANFITKRFSLELIENIIKENPNRLIIAYQNENPVGVAEIIYNSTCPIRKIKVPELSKLYVLKRFYGKGIGYGLINEAEKAVKEHGFTEFNLEVYIKNDRAIAFYERQGYTSIGNVDFPMESNTYENLVMNKVFN